MPLPVELDIILTPHARSRMHSRLPPSVDLGALDYIRLIRVKDRVRRPSIWLLRVEDGVLFGDLEYLPGCAIYIVRTAFHYLRFAKYQKRTRFVPDGLALFRVTGIVLIDGALGKKRVSGRIAQIRDVLPAAKQVLLSADSQRTKELMKAGLSWILEMSPGDLTSFRDEMEAALNMARRGEMDWTAVLGVISRWKHCREECTSGNLEGAPAPLAGQADVKEVGAGGRGEEPA